MWKKIIITAVTLSFSLFGISCSKNDNSSVNYNPDEECTISISWWGGDERHDATNQAIELFENKYPNIKVEVDYGSWSGWKNKIFDELENNSCTDVIQVNYDWLVTLSYDGSGFYDLEKLDDYINLSNFSDDILSFGRRNGVLNAIPVSVTGRSVFYNKDVYDKAGVALPETWNDLFEIAPKLNAVGSYPLEADTGTGFTAFYLAVVYEQQKTGHQFITDDSKIGFTVDELADALAFYKKMQDCGVIRSISEIDKDSSASSLYESEAWKNGTVAGIAEWGSSVAKYQSTLENPDNLVMGNLLTMENAQSTGWFYKPSLLFAINKDTQYPVQSAILLDFLYNDTECAEILGTSRGIPVSKSAFNALENSGQLSGLAYDSNNMILQSNPVLISPYMENSEMQEYYNDAIESVSLEILTPEEAAQGIYANIVYTLNSVKEGN